MRRRGDDDSVERLVSLAERQAEHVRKLQAALDDMTAIAERGQALNDEAFAAVLAARRAIGLAIELTRGGEPQTALHVLMVARGDTVCGCGALLGADASFDHALAVLRGRRPDGERLQ